MRTSPPAVTARTPPPTRSATMSPPAVFASRFAPTRSARTSPPAVSARREPLTVCDADVARRGGGLEVAGDRAHDDVAAEGLQVRARHRPRPRGSRPSASGSSRGPRPGRRGSCRRVVVDRKSPDDVAAHDLAVEATAAPEAREARVRGGRRGRGRARGAGGSGRRRVDRRRTGGATCTRTSGIVTTKELRRVTRRLASASLVPSASTTIAPLSVSSLTSAPPFPMEPAVLVPRVDHADVTHLALRLPASRTPSRVPSSIGRLGVLHRGLRARSRGRRGRPRCRPRPCGPRRGARASVRLPRGPRGGGSTISSRTGSGKVEEIVPFIVDADRSNFASFGQRQQERRR